LRFPEFQGEWEETLLENVCIINPKTSPLRNEFIYIDLESVVKGQLININHTLKSEAPSRAQRVLQDNDILFQCVRPYQLNNYVHKQYDSNQWVASTGYAQIRTSNDTNFLYQLLNSPMFNKEVMLRCTGSSYPAISSSDLGKISIVICSKKEQEKIGLLLSLIDERISTQIKIIEKYESLIKGICQNLINFRGKDKLKEIYLRDILVERKETNKDNYPIFSVSVSKGVVNQIEYLGRSFAAKDTSHYNVVHFGDIIYTKSPTGSFPYGIIKQSFIQENVAVSPLYGVFIPENICVANILHYYFNNPINTNNYLCSLIQKGAKNTISITNQHFLDKKLSLPINDNEIEIMAKLLNTITQKIFIENKVLNDLICQKQYLLKEMFI